MASHPTSEVHLPARRSVSLALPPRVANGLKAFLTAVMGLLSILVFGLSCEQRNVSWLWVGFVCALVSGIFVQILINRVRK
jgi:hypothetical protein